MRNPLIKQFEQERDALSRRISMLSQIALQLQYSGLCGYSFGESYGEEIDEATPAQHRRAHVHVLHSWSAAAAAK